MDPMPALQKLPWPSSTRITWPAARVPAYWDFAAANRELWDVYSTWECLDERCDNIRDPHSSRRSDDSYDDHYRPKKKAICFRKQNLGLLELLQRRAYVEVKSKVKYVTGDRLPAELMDELLLFALAAEGVPEDVEVWEMDMKAKPKSWKMKPSVPSSCLGWWRMKERYRCSTYREASDDSDGSGSTGSSSGTDV
jgi:hypothetical protein